MFPLGNRFHNHADGSRRRHNRRTGHLNQLLVAGSLLHHMFEKEIVDLMPSRCQILPLQDRTNIVGHLQGRFLAEDLPHRPLRLFVTGIDQWKFVGRPESGPWFRRRDILRHFHDMGHCSSVRPAGHQNHIRPHRPNAFDLFIRQTSIVRCQHIDHNRPGTQRRALRAFTGHVLHDTRHHHLQPAARTAG